MLTLENIEKHFKNNVMFGNDSSYSRNEKDIWSFLYPQSGLNLAVMYDESKMARGLFHKKKS